MFLLTRDPFHQKSELRFDGLLGDRSPPDWADEIDQVLVRGTRFIVEVAFLHRDSRTLVLTDLVENIGDATPDASDRLLRFWWKFVFRMWNRPRPAPEYQLGWRDKAAAVLMLWYPGMEGGRALASLLLGNAVPSGKLPIDVDIVVNNVASMAALADAFDRGHPLVERPVTVAGPGVERPGNLIVPVGTPVRAVLRQAGMIRIAIEEAITAFGFCKAESSIKLG